jgi:GrpB-like predicted nucleotidyltransferase (UPF0157 family)
MTEEPVHITPYDASWPRRFEREKALLSNAIAEWLSGPIEHVGSTAIPDMPAKPVIDIMAGVASLEASRSAIPVLEAHGYCYFPYKTEVTSKVDSLV